MWTLDMNRCPACSKKETCEDRKKILRALSPVLNDINLDEAGEHADGLIIVACKS